MNPVLQDVRSAVRTLLAARGLALAAILSLGLGIGANTTIFAWMKATVLQPLPGVAEPERMVVVGTRNAAGADQSLSYPEFLDFRARTASLSGLVAQEVIAVNVRREQDRQAQRIYGAIVSGNYFEVLGVTAALGRVFTAAHDVKPDAHPVAVISHAVWQARFNADRSMIGKTIIVNGRAFTLLGVTPAGFNGTFMGLGMGIWLPTMMQKAIVPGADRLDARGIRWLVCLGRLRPGVSVKQANAEMVTIAAQLARAYPRDNERRSAVALPLSQAPWGSPFFMRPVLSVLGVLVMLVLLIACANVANLLLARAVGRQREVAIRLSLGATRARLVRQLLLESLLLAALAGIAGVVVARVSAQLLNAFVPPIEIPIILALAIDRGTLLFAGTVSLMTGIVFGLVPALQASRPDLVSTLKDSGAQSGGSRSRSRLRHALVVAQIAFCTVLLVAAGLLLRSLHRSYTLDPGFSARTIVLASFDLFPNGYTPETGAAFERRLLERVGTVPGIRSASIVRRMPLSAYGTSSVRVRVDGYTPAQDESMDVGYNVVAPGAFAALGIPLLRGRDFEWPDDGGRRPVAIVNDTLAKRYFGTVEIVGRQLSAGKNLEIVGVVPTGKYDRLNEPAHPHLYLPLLQSYRPEATLVINYRDRADGVMPQVRTIVRELDPNLPLVDVKTLDEHLQFASFPQRIASTMLALFGGLALVLAVIGLYAVISYAVSQRTREIGLRIALGARTADIGRDVLGQAGRLILVGLAIGTVAASVSMRFAAALLNGISPADPAVLASVATGLAAIALLATAIPALRAARIDPIVALRQE